VALRAHVLHTDQPFDPSAPLRARNKRICWKTVALCNLPGVSYLIGTGWWILWYGTLWLAVAPFVVMTAMLTRATPNEPMELMEKSFAIGSVGLFVLMTGTAISGILWTVGGSAQGAWPYVRNVGVAILVALIVGFAFIFAAGFYAVVRENPMPNRWAAQLICLASALGLLFLCLHATWRFRHR
jgi:hypothetical protein